MQKIKQLELDSRVFRQRDRLDAWNGVFGDLTEVHPGSNNEDYIAHLEGFDLTRAVLVQHWAPGFDVCRDNRKLATGSVDSVAVFFCTTPSWDVWGKGGIKAAGDLIFTDYTRPFLVRNAPGNVDKTGFVFERRLLEDRISDVNALHGQSIAARDPRARLFTRTIKLLQRALPNLVKSDGPILAGLIADLMSACLKPNHHRNEMERQALLDSKRLMVKSFIEANLRDPNLGPAMICAHCGFSQSRLYDLMPGRGGVAHYIWTRRLERAAEELCQPLLADENISTIAEAFGFTRPSHFSTAFKREFGTGPRDWRRYRASLAHDDVPQNPPPASIYVRQLIDQRLGT